MDTGRKHANEQASSQSSVFRFNDLPRELQDLIYEFSSFKPHVEFLLTDRDHLDTRFSLTRLISKDGSIEIGGGKFEKGNIQGLTSSDTGDDSFLMFKICFSTPLLLVSKRTNADVRNLLGIRHRVFMSTIQRNHIVNPNSLFMDTCLNSRFTFIADGPHPETFWTSILPQMQPYIHSLVVRQEHSQSTKKDRIPVFAHLLPELFPGLRTIAFETPYSLKEVTQEMSHMLPGIEPPGTKYSPKHQLVLACDMLASKKVDVVLVFFQKPTTAFLLYMHYLYRYLEHKLSTWFQAEYLKNFEFFDESPDSIYRRNGITSFSDLPNVVTIRRRTVARH